MDATTPHSGTRTGVPSTIHLLKGSLSRDADALDRERLDDDSDQGRIRCPVCAWRPTASSRWTCHVGDTPEPPFDACGTVWNTFETRGRCPGCGHQWFWTTCPRCEEASPHQEWYQG